MTDIMSKAERSRHMSLVRGRNTRFELEFFRLVSAMLYPMGFRYRKHCRHMFGTPDLVFAKFKVAVFVDSDFWHGRNYSTLADRMTPFWRDKIERNMRRDRRVNRRLRKEGWVVLRFGEKQVKRTPSAAVERIKRELMARRLLIVGGSIRVSAADLPAAVAERSTGLLQVARGWSKSGAKISPREKLLREIKTVP